MRAQAIVENYVKEQDYAGLLELLLRLDRDKPVVESKIGEALPDRSREEVNELVMNNIGVARSVTSLMYDGSMPYEDLYSVALDGLFAAAEHWDANQSSKFSTYAYKAITRWIKRAKYKQSKIRYHEPSLSSPIGGEDDDNTLEDIIPDSDDTAEDATQSIDKSQAIAELRSAINNVLDDRERRAVEDYFINELDLRTIGAKMNINRVTMQRLLTHAVDKLRKVMRGRGFLVPDNPYISLRPH